MKKIVDRHSHFWPVQIFVLIGFKDMSPRLYFAFKCINTRLRGHIVIDCTQNYFWSKLTFIFD